MAIKILMIFFGIYMIISLAVAGGGLYFVLEELFPEVDPMLSLSKYLIYWVLGELLFCIKKGRTRLTPCLLKAQRY